MDCMISYNADQSIKDRFDSWEQVEIDWTYTMRSVGEYMEKQKDRKELFTKLQNSTRNVRIVLVNDYIVMSIGSMGQ